MGADKDVNGALIEEEEDVIDEEEEEEDVEDEDLEEEDSEDEEEDEEDVEDEDLSKAKSKDPSEVKFSAKQQAFIDNLIQTRLTRASAQYDQQLQEAAGVGVDRTEILSAANLWGFLKLNPKLSNDVQGLINAFIATGNFVPQKKGQDNAKENALNKREAILDLKASDAYFASKSKAILEWAEDEGFDIHDAKSLKRAYLAYKGANGTLDRADAEYRKKRVEAKKQGRKGTAMVKGSGAPRKGGGKKPTDYKKMSDTDILASEGIKLFTED